MVIIVDGDGNVKSVPSSVPQGTALHDVTIIAPFTTSTCVLKIKPVSAEWIEDNLAVATTTTDGAGVVFKAEIPGAVTELPGRVKYQLAFTGQDSSVKISKVGSISVTPSVLTDVPESAEELSAYSLGQVYAMLASVANNIRGFRKTLGLTKTAIPLTVTIPSASWGGRKTVTVAVEEVTAQSVVIVSFVPSEIDAFSSAELVCTAQGDGSLTFSCKEIPTEDLSVQVLVFESVEISDDTGDGGTGGGDTGGGEDDEETLTLSPPMISLNGDTLNLTPVANATAYEVTIGSTLIYDGTSTSINLKTLLASSGFVAGSYAVRAKAKNTDGASVIYSPNSNYLTYTYEVENVEEYLNAPTISLVGDTLYITPQGGNVYADTYVLLANNIIVTYFTASSLNVKTAFAETSATLEYGSYSLTVKALNFDADVVSDHSNAVTYVYSKPYVNAPTISIDGSVLTVTPAASSGSVSIKQYQLIIGGEHYGYLSPIAQTINLDNLGLDNGTYSVWVNARNDEEGADPAASNTVTCKIGMTVTLTLKDASYMGETLYYYINVNAAEIGNTQYASGSWTTNKQVSIVLNEGDVVALHNGYSLFPSVENTTGCSASVLSKSDGSKYIRVSGFAAESAMLEIRYT